MSHHLLNLPLEVLHRVLGNVDPQDLGRLCCCRALNGFIKGNRLLWKELYLRNFDDPRRKIDRKLRKTESLWETALQKLVKLRKLLESTNADLKKQNVNTIAESVDKLLQSTEGRATSKTSRNLEFLDEQFRNEQNNQTLLCGSSLFQWALSHASNDIPSCVLPQEHNIDPSIPDEPHNLSHVFVGHDENSSTPSGIPVVDHDTEPLVTASEPDRPFSHRQQICAKLHCLYGVPIDYITKNLISNSRYNLRYKSLLIHPYVRSRVYDLRQHTAGTLWGPFTDDGTQEVDWEKVESVMLILNHNMKRYSSRYVEPVDETPAWDQAFAGANPYSYSSSSFDRPKEPAAPLDSQDPYGVTGTWMRVVCFLDYTELYDFNFSDVQPAADQPRPPLDTEEATRLIAMKVKVTKIEPPGEEDGKALPVVHFKGLSSSLRPSWDPNANSRIRGTVRLTPKGEIRWTTVSIIHGEERWRSEGIQIGGIQSARGVLGYWFDKDYDLHGPAGPTAFWKLHDGFEEKKDSD